MGNNGFSQENATVGAFMPDGSKANRKVKVNEVALMISAEQGKGVNTAGDMIGGASARMGLYVYQNIEYFSNIQGKNSYSRIILSESPVHAHHDKSDVAVLLGGDAMTHAIDKVCDGGAVIYNTEDTKRNFESQEKVDKAIERINSDQIVDFGIPAGSIIKKLSNAKEVKKTVLTKMANTVLVGAVYAVMGADIVTVNKAIEFYFSFKPAMIPINLEAAKLGFDYIKDNFTHYVPIKITDISDKVPADEKRFVMKGTNAIALGAVAAGMQYYTYYPITPAGDTGDLIDAWKEKAQMVVEQVEDEIAAMNGAIGAARTGVRAMTGTSGPGFDLKSEAFGMATMNEDPVVVMVAQRPGPSTGLPTRGDQSDLMMALYSSHGGGERIVLMPGDLEDSFYMIQEAFNVADVYQMPVIFLPDKHIMNSTETIPAFDLDRVPIDRGQVFDVQAEFDAAYPDGDFMRYKFTDTGISPRTVPGIVGGEFHSSSDEHTEEGIITDDPTNRIKKIEKRLKKVALLASKLTDEQQYSVYGDKDADVTIIGWGGTKGPILDGIKLLKKDGYSVKYVQIKYANPFPAKQLKEILANSKTNIILEENRLSVPLEDGTVGLRGQMEIHIRSLLGYTFDKRILKVNSRPFSMEEVRDLVAEHINDKSKTTLFGERI